MASRWFIINEWLFSNLSGERDSDQDDPEILKQAKEDSVRFLELLFDRIEDGIVVPRDCPWIRKAYQWADRANKSGGRERNLSKRFFREVLLQPSRRIELERDDLKELPPELRRLIRTHKDDKIEEYINDEDEYLLLTWLSSPVRIEFIVTTDTALQDALARHYPAIKTRHRDDFLAEYLSPPAQ
ncbi:MAG: hypothetical protein OXG25_01135 [Gammaproteobacteria bacterium]|nr:hypothetical protein [Gammaproteobacteria bacterium]MCY3908303.1 hypothetical protein [Anaerolineaceae bacterium]